MALRCRLTAHRGLLMNCRCRRPFHLLLLLRVSLFHLLCLLLVLLFHLLGTRSVGLLLSCLLMLLRLLLR